MTRIAYLLAVLALMTLQGCAGFEYGHDNHHPYQEHSDPILYFARKGRDLQEKVYGDW